MKNFLIVCLAVALAAVGVYAFYGDRLEAPADGEAPAADSYSRADLSWTFRDEGEDLVALSPRTRVILSVRGEAYDLGVRQGSCAEANASALQPGDLAAATCWWAGAGDEFRVAQPTPGKLVVFHREVEEGTAEGPGVATEFRALLSI